MEHYTERKISKIALPPLVGTGAPVGNHLNGWVRGLQGTTAEIVHK